MEQELKQQEAVRDRSYPLAQRWQHIQERIAWAEQHVVHRNTPARCVAEQRRQWPMRDNSPPSAP